MFYGPVQGGLPISAWHCEVCGLLRLTYPDGRKEERRLFPGPQPGLIAEAVAGDLARYATHGEQARVSGISVPSDMLATLLPEPEPIVIRLPQVHLPDLGWVNWLTAALLTFTALGLLGLGYGAIAYYKTADWEGGLAAAVGSAFGAAVLLQVLAAGFRQLFPWPQLGPGPAEVHRGAPQLDGTTRLIVTLLSVVLVGLAVAGTLAIYDWRTPGAEAPLVYGLMSLFGLTLIIAVIAVAVRHLPPRS
jgi:hypothetical protein